MAEPTLRVDDVPFLERSFASEAAFLDHVAKQTPHPPGRTNYARLLTVESGTSESRRFTADVGREKRRAVLDSAVRPPTGTWPRRERFV